MGPARSTAYRATSQPWNLIDYALLSAFSLANVIAAIFAPIQDCDEVFNYWEPTHYLNRGFGLQTWEYSPEFAIRSWLYIILHAAVGRMLYVAEWATGLELPEFFWIRLSLGLVCAFCQTRLFRAVSKHVGFRVALLMALVMLSSTGMFYASVAYLPSSFSMYTTMMGFAAFLDAQGEPGTAYGIIWFGIGAIAGWPFSAALILPLLIDELVYLRLSGKPKETASRVLHGCVRILPIIVRAIHNLTKLKFTLW